MTILVDLFVKEAIETNFSMKRRENTVDSEKERLAKRYHNIQGGGI